ncbi:hypothetical protein ACSQ67_024956 [Phaseolus vulgaris]
MEDTMVLINQSFDLVVRQPRFFTEALHLPERLALEGGPSFRGQDVTQTSCSNRFSELQNDNLQLKDLHSNGDQNLNNQLSVPNTFGINNFNGLNINQSSSNPGMVHPNMVQVTPAIETYASGVFAPPQRPAFFPLQNHISNSPSAWNSSRPQHTQFSSPHMYCALSAPNHMQSLSTVHNQVGHSSELQRIHGLQSQNSIWPVNPMYPRLEPYSGLDTALVPMPSMPYQQGFRPMLPEPAVRSAFSVANYGQQPSLSVMSNSHGSGSSVPPTNQMYSSLYQNQNQGHYHHPQVIMMPNNQAQQRSASMQQWSQGVSNHNSKYNQRMNTPNLQRHSSRAEASSSRLSIAPVLRIQEEATIPNEVRISRDMYVERTSSTRSQPSEAIRRILDMNPSRLIRRSITAGQTERVHYKPPPRGRPPKRNYEEYFQREKLHKVSSEIGNAGTTSTSQQAQHIPCSYQNAAATNAPIAPRQYVNSLCDIELGRMGHSFDPQLTLFKPGPTVTSSFYPRLAQNWHHTICTFRIPMLLPRILYVRCPTQTPSIVNKQARKPPISNNEPKICSVLVQQPPSLGSLLLHRVSSIVRMPNGHGQQSSASVPQWFQIGECNLRMMSPNLQRQINTIIGSQTLISGILGHSSTRTTEVTSSRVPNSREAEIAQVLRMQQEATLSTNEVQTSRDTGKHLATSSTG